MVELILYIRLTVVTDWEQIAVESSERIQGEIEKIDQPLKSFNEDEQPLN